MISNSNVRYTHYFVVVVVVVVLAAAAAAATEAEAALASGQLTVCNTVMYNIAVFGIDISPISKP